MRTRHVLKAADAREPRRTALLPVATQDSSGAAREIARLRSMAVRLRLAA